MEERQYHAIRDKSAHIHEALEAVTKHLEAGDWKTYPKDLIARDLERVAFLARVLELSATWDGVETMEFFPPDARSFLESHDMLRLGKFFNQPYVDVSKELHRMNLEYPPLLHRLFTAYYARMGRDPLIRAAFATHI